MAAIPLSWDDPMFSGVTSSNAVTLKNGATLSDKSITDSGNVASVVGNGSFTLDGVRINSSEGVRLGGSGDIVINNSYIETTGKPGDHADGIQAYSPGSTGNVTITNSTIVSHNSNATAGMFVADDYNGTFTFDNVVFQGGPIGLRLNADDKDLSVSLKDVYFVGPFQYDPILFQEVNADIHITHWENVRYATIVNGELVPGALIKAPLPVEGGGTAPQAPQAPQAPEPTVDTHAPGASTLGVFTDSGKAVSGTTTVDDFLLKGTAEANSTIKVFDAGKQIGTAKTTADGNWSYDTGHLADGQHSFASTAVDAAGNTSALSSAKGVTVIDAPATASTDLGITDVQRSSYSTVAIEGTADAYSQVKVYDGSHSIGSVTADGNGSWSLSAQAWSKAIHTFSAEQLDHAGEVVASSGSAIMGTRGDNTLASTSGDDVLMGKGGSDTFVFAPNFGNDVINDFRASGWGHDTVQFDKDVFDDFSDVLAHATQAGDHVTIQAPHGDSLTLKNVNLSDLNQYDFHFA